MIPIQFSSILIPSVDCFFGGFVSWNWNCTDVPRILTSKLYLELRKFQYYKDGPRILNE